MKIVVDQNIRGAEDTFGRHATLLVKDGRDIGAADLVDADALIVRTATEVNRDLLQSSPVRFVGTTSIGTDHMDTGWLDRHGIEWASAPGCNADSAAQYSLAMIWLACQRLGRRLDQLCVGIIGRGNVGSRLHRLLQALGVETVANDPPLAELGATDLVPLERALTQDIVTLHVPLTRNGPHQTFGMIGKKQLAFMADGALLVNAARGDVIDGNALTRELRTGRLFAAIDTWPGEPMIQRELLEAAVVATPHVAGYSNDGKRLGTWMVYQAFCKWAALTPHDMPDPPGSRPQLTVPGGADCVTHALEAACFVPHHDAAMKSLLAVDIQKRASAFDRLRREYPSRRDFHAWAIDCREPGSRDMLLKLGFCVDTTE